MEMTVDERPGKGQRWKRISNHLDYHRVCENGLDNPKQKDWDGIGGAKWQNEAAFDNYRPSKTTACWEMGFHYHHH